MHPFLKPLLAISALGLAAALPSAHAQLLLSGTSYGAFDDPALTYTSVSNSAAVSLFESGVPYRPFAPYNDTKTSIEFTSSTFADVGDGDQLDLGALQIENGITLLGTTAGWASMNLFLNLPEYGVLDFKLTTLLFTIDNTANGPGLANVPDLFLVGHTAENSLVINGNRIHFDVQLTKPQFGAGDGASISEGSFADLGLYATVNFTPVPEPSTYALWGTALLVGFVGLRRFRAAPTTA